MSAILVIVILILHTVSSVKIVQFAEESSFLWGVVSKPEVLELSSRRRTVQEGARRRSWRQHNEEIIKLMKDEPHLRAADCH